MVQRIVMSVLLSGAACFAQDTIAHFSTRAQWHRALKKPVPGMLLFDDSGLEFQSRNFSHRWLYSEIKTFDLSGARELLITDYENRHWREAFPLPNAGERRFRFTLTVPVPPTVA